MPGNIHSDHGRFRNIVKGQVRESLKKYIVNGDLIGREEKGIVKIPLPYIGLPKFVYDDSENSGLGEGDGEEDDLVYDENEAGNEPGEVIYDAELTLDEIAEILGEELGLEDLKPKSIDRLFEERNEYKSIRRSGPESLRHFKRTYKQALKRQIASGEYDPLNPRIIPVRQDKHYRSWKRTPEPNAKAVIFHMRDISGSMDDDKVEIVRRIIWWEDLWIRAKYKDQMQHVYLVHNVDAWEVDRNEFFKIRGSEGGTIISSIMGLQSSYLTGQGAKFHPDNWNIYSFYYSDGDNYGDDDNGKCKDILINSLLPHVNSFCYGHISKSTTNFQSMLQYLNTTYPAMKIATIPTKLQILDALRIFLGKKK